MKSRLQVLGLVVGMFVAFSCIGKPATNAASRGQTVGLYRETSTPGESRDSFVTRIAARAVKASKTARAALCGEVEGAEIYSVNFKTDGYSDECSIPHGSAIVIAVNGTAVDARENHFSRDMLRRTGYLITPWAVKFRDSSGVRKVAELTE